MKLKLAIIFAIGISFQSLAQEGGWVSFLRASRAGRPLQDGQSLWVPTDAGLLEVDLENRTTALWNKATAGLSSNSIEAVTRNPVTGEFFIGTYDVALLSRPGQQGAWAELPYPEAWSGDPFNPVQTYCIAFSEDGNLWAGTNQGLFRFDGQEWSRFNQSNAHPFLGAVWDIQPAPDGGLYLASHLLFHYKDGAFTAVSPQQLGDHFLFAYSGAKMHRQQDGSLWFFTDIGKVAHFDGQEWEVLSEIGGQPFFQAPAFVGETPEGSLLVLLNSSGLYQYSQGQWLPYAIDVEPGLLQLHFLDEGWVAVYPDKAAIHQDGVTEELSYGAWPFENIPYAFRYDAAGSLWVKDGYNELLNLDTWERLAPQGEESPDFIIDYDFGPSSVLWAVSGSAAYRFSQGAWQKFGPDNSALPGSTGYRSIISDGAGGAWLYIYNSGLYRFESGAWKKQQHPAFGLNYIIQMEAGAAGELWLHLYDSGQGSRLARWNGAQLNIYTAGEEGYQAGLSDVMCYDRETGRLWTAGPGALQFHDGQGWQQLAFDPGLPLVDYFHSLAVRGETIVAAGRTHVYLGNAGQWTVFSSKNSPLANEILTEVGLGQQGGLWMLHQSSRVVDRYESGVISGEGKNLPRLAYGEMRLYPNPARDVLHLEWEGMEGGGEVEILLFNALGQLHPLEILNPGRDGGAISLPVGGLRSGWHRLVLRSGGRAYAASFLKH